MKTMRNTVIILQVFVIMLAFTQASPGVLAAMQFGDEYGTELVDVYIPNEDGTMTLLSTEDLVDVNNFNKTISPFMEENNIQGIPQYCLDLPMVFELNATTTPGLYSVMLSWLHIPSANLLHDTVMDSWLRLPFNNMVLGTDSWEVDLAIDRLYTDGYNISHGNNMDDMAILAGPHGDTPHERIYRERYYDVDINPFGPVPGIDIYPPRDYFLHDNNRVVEWTTVTPDETRNEMLEYDFTWVRVTAPLERGKPYIFTLEVLFYDDLTNRPEIIFTEGDHNGDNFFLSHVSFDGEQADIPFDLDVPMIYVDMMSRNVGGIGLWQNTRDEPNIWSFAPVEAFDGDGLITKVGLPIYAYRETNITIGVLWAFADGSVGANIATTERTLSRGFNVMHVQGAVPSYGEDVVGVGVYVGLYNSEDGSVAANLSFMVQQVYEASSLVGTIQQNTSFEPMHLTNVFNDTYMGVGMGTTFLYRSYMPLVFAHKTDATSVTFFPLDRYEVYVVPDIYDYNGSMQYIEYAEVAKMLVHDAGLWWYPEAAIDPTGITEEHIRTALIVAGVAVVCIVGWKVVGPAILAKKAIAFSPIGAGALGTAGAKGGVALGGGVLAGLAFGTKVKLAGVGMTAGAFALNYLIHGKGIRETAMDAAGWISNVLRNLLQDYFPSLYEALDWMWGGLVSFGKFIWEGIEWLANNLANLITRLLQFTALWMMLSVYIAATWVTNGLITAVCDGRRMKKKTDNVLSLDVFRKQLNHTWDQYWKIVSLNMMIIAGVFSVLHVVLRVVSPI